MSFFNGHMSLRNRCIDIKDNSCEFQESLEKVFLVFFHVCRLMAEAEPVLGFSIPCARVLENIAS